MTTVAALPPPAVLVGPALGPSRPGATSSNPTSPPSDTAPLPTPNQNQNLSPPLPAPALAGRPTPAPLQLTHRRRDPGLSSEGAVRARYPTTLQQGASVQPRPQTQPPLPPHLAPHNAPVPRRPSKPIFDWISRKLGARRGSDADHADPKAVAAVRTQAKRVADLPRRRVATGAPLGHRSQNQPFLDSQPPANYRTQLTFRDREGSRPRSRSSFESPSLSRRSESMSLHSYAFSNVSERRREANNPYPSLPIPLVRRSYPASTVESSSRPPSLSIRSRSRASSLGSVSSLAHRRPRISIADDASATESGRVADEDASVRPIPPSPTQSTAPSAVISRSGSAPILLRSESLMRSESNTCCDPHRTGVDPLPPPGARRDTMSSSLGGGHSSFSDEDGLQSCQNSVASTKPTTVMSLESSAPAHIAVAPPSTSGSPPPVVRTMSSPTGMSVTSGTSFTHGLPSPVSPTFVPPSGDNDVRVPRHTRYHPRNNPHPSSPPAPDASTVTLASSTFGLVSSPVERHHGSIRLRDGTSPSAYHPPSIAFTNGHAGSVHDGVSTHAMSFSLRGARGHGADDDASMRAIRRRGSWESAESRWSWRPGAAVDSASVFSSAALHRRSELLEGVDDVVNNRSSTYTRDSYRTPLTGFNPDAEDSELSAFTSETALTTHRPVDVCV